MDGVRILRGAGRIGGLVLLHRRQNHRAVPRVFGGRRQLARVLHVALVEQQAARIVPRAPRHQTAVAAIKDHRQPHALVQRRIEDLRHLMVADIHHLARPRIRRHNRRVHRLLDGPVPRNIHGHHQLVPQAVLLQRPMPREVKDHRIATLRLVDKVLPHRRQNARASGLRRGQHRHSRRRSHLRRMLRPRIDQHPYLRRRKSQPRRQHRGHRVRVVYRALQIGPAQQREPADAAVFAHGALRSGALGLIQVNADHQRTPGLGRAPSRAQQRYDQAQPCAASPHRSSVAASASRATATCSESVSLSPIPPPLAWWSASAP